MELPEITWFIALKILQGFAFSFGWHFLFGMLLGWTQYLEEI